MPAAVPESSSPLAAHPLTMSTLEIAGLTGKLHKHVLADARKVLVALDLRPAEFSARYRDAKGEDREVIDLPKRECLILVSGYSIEMRARIIDRWLDLETALAGGPGRDRRPGRQPPVQAPQPAAPVRVPSARRAARLDSETGGCKGACGARHRGSVAERWLVGGAS